MKIQSILFPTLAFAMVSCHSDKPADKPLMASRSADSIKAEWLKPHEAVLCVRIEGEEPTDLLEAVHVAYSDNSGSYRIDAKTDQLMTHPFDRDYAVLPCEDQTSVEISTEVNDTVYSIRTLLPHLLLDTRTQLNLSLSGNRLRMVSSWIEDSAAGVREAPVSVDTVRVGCYLDGNGTVTAGYSATSVAMVVETDGRHGKAVALNDVGGEWIFSSQGCSTGLLSETLDGSAREGSLPKRWTEGDSLSCLLYYPEMKVPQGCAFSQRDGFRLCQQLHSHSDERELKREDMLRACLLKEGSYIPTAAEMADLWYMSMGYAREQLTGTHLKLPSGAYLTSSESSEDTFYSIDFNQGALTGHTSKRYTPLRVRLFYIF